VAQRTGCARKTIQSFVSEGVLRLGEHYDKPRGKLVFRWSAVRRWMAGTTAADRLEAVDRGLARLQEMNAAVFAHIREIAAEPDLSDLDPAGGRSSSSSSGS
jgi:hypothetical protein